MYLALIILVKGSLNIVQMKTLGSLGSKPQGSNGNTECTRREHVFFYIISFKDQLLK